MGKIRSSTQSRHPFHPIERSTARTPVQTKTGLAAQRGIPRHPLQSTYSTIQRHVSKHSLARIPQRNTLNDENGAFFKINSQNAPQEVREEADDRNSHLLKFQASLYKLSWQHRLEKSAKKYFSALRTLDKAEPHELQQAKAQLKNVEGTYTQLVEHRDALKTKRIHALKALD